MADPKAESKKPDTSYLESLKANLDSIASPEFNGRPGYLGVAKVPLTEAADDVLQNMDAKGQPLDKDKLANFFQLNPDAEVKGLGNAWEKAEALLGFAQNKIINAIKAEAKAEVEKLFESPSKFENEEWQKVFQNNIDEFKKNVTVQRKAIAVEANELLHRSPAEKDEIEARKKEQLDALDKLETHFTKSLEHQRDTAVFKAMTECPFGGAPPVDPNASAAVISGGLNAGKDAMTLAKHAEHLRVAEPDTLRQLRKIKHPHLLWDVLEKIDFDNNGLVPGKYTTHPLEYCRFINWFVKKDFEITDTGIKVNKSLLGVTTANCSLMLEAYLKKTGNKDGTLSIEKHVTLSAVEKFGSAVVERNKAGKKSPTLELDDQSIKHLLDQKSLFGRARNSPEEIAKACVSLKGLEFNPKEAEDSIDNKKYKDALETAMARVTNLASELSQEQEKGAEQQKSGSSRPTAKARS